MAASDDEPLTRMLREVENGRQSAAELLPLVYDELRRLARRKMAAEAPGHTFQATVLVHEAWLRVVGDGDPGWNSRGHFLAAAAQAMRRILVEQARRRARQKRGGDQGRVDLSEGVLAIEGPAADVLGVEDAVQRLEVEDPRKGQIVNLRYFAGLTNEQTAQAMGLSVGTIEREWRFIRAWLQTELEDH